MENVFLYFIVKDSFPYWSRLGWIACFLARLDVGLFKNITLFVFAKIEMYCNVSQNTDRIGIISASAAYCEAGAASQQMIIQPSLSS